MSIALDTDKPNVSESATAMLTGFLICHGNIGKATIDVTTGLRAR